MSAHPTSLANDIRSAGAPIDPAKVSITKWKPVEAVVAEALNLDPEEVYGTTISKAGNLSVRVGQSKRGRNAPVVLLMYTGPNGELERCIDAAKEHCSDRDLALVFVEDTRGWTLVGIMKPQSAAVPPALAVGYPTASVDDF